MTSFFTPFSRSRAGNAWFCAGPTSSFYDMTSEDAGQLAGTQPHPCQGDQTTDAGTACKVFHVPKEDSSKATEVALNNMDAAPELGGLRDQVLVFQYKGKFHAINHVSKRSNPISRSSIRASLLMSRLGVPPLVISSVQRYPLRH